jgi:hypothetical protein
MIKTPTPNQDTLQASYGRNIRINIIHGTGPPPTQRKTPPQITIRFLALTVIASLYRSLKSYVAVAAISLSSPERNARSTAVVNSWFIRSSCSVE